MLIDSLTTITGTKLIQAAYFLIIQMKLQSVNSCRICCMILYRRFGWRSPSSRLWIKSRIRTWSPNLLKKMWWRRKKLSVGLLSPCRKKKSSKRLPRSWRSVRRVQFSLSQQVSPLSRTSSNASTTLVSGAVTNVPSLRAASKMAKPKTWMLCRLSTRFLIQ